MKAEQRKELETNTLADKMGQVVHKVKGGSRRTFFIYVGVAAALLFALWFSYRWYITDRIESSFKWVRFHDGAQVQLEHLALQTDEQGKAARFQIAWFQYWEEGIKSIAADPRGGVISLHKARKNYEDLAKLCKDDPIYEPQAMLGQAVAAESLAVQERSSLVEATKLYEALATHEKYGEKGEKMTAEAKFAKDRLEILKDDQKKIALGIVYDKLQTMLGVPRVQNALPDLDRLPPLVAPKN